MRTYFRPSARVGAPTPHLSSPLTQRGEAKNDYETGREHPRAGTWLFVVLDRFLGG